jgi:hypothetical protein
MTADGDTFVTTRVHEAMHEVRDLVNLRRRHRALMAYVARYHTICSAMDLIGDTTEALHAYQLGNGEHDRGSGRAYLVAYGVLQALYLQQDALFWLCKHLDVTPVSTFDSPGAWARTMPALDAARTARNNTD